MIQITPLALNELSTFISRTKSLPSVRISLTPVNCGGDGQLFLTVDNGNPDDYTLKAGDLNLIISQKLLELTGKVTIDFKWENEDSGFVVETEKILPAIDSDCDGCSGCFI
ncbi:MAG: hypothetical protein LBF22_08365 [Deltaproteobacteria bacterium]|jgi:Fe-S cluster assembly iron-binding protein IscA|nr:hypothetical protein [Deltaproteobacteria bacterium]